jgi:hypothetical protein
VVALDERQHHPGRHQGVAEKYTYTAQQFYRGDSPLLPSGLLGPVQVVRIAGR